MKLSSWGLVGLVWLSLREPGVEAAADRAVGDVDDVVRWAEHDALATRIGAPAPADDAGDRADVGRDLGDDGVRVLFVHQDLRRPLSGDLGPIRLEEFPRELHPVKSIKNGSLLSVPCPVGRVGCLVQCQVVALSGANANRLADRHDDNLAIAGIARPVDVDDRANNSGDRLVRGKRRSTSVWGPTSDRGPTG